jgi:4-hydroxy-tetrahydrodipicolinate synthase
MPISFLATLEREFPDRVLFKPEAPPVGLRLGELLSATEGRARVIDGTGGAALSECFPRGVIGTMPAADLTWAVGALWLALCDGDRDRADKIRGPLAAFMSLEQSLDAYIVIGKHLLVKEGIFKSAAVRSPVTFNLDGPLMEEIDALLAQLRVVASRETTR